MSSPCGGTRTMHSRCRNSAWGNVWPSLVPRRMNEVCAAPRFSLGCDAN